MMAVGAQGDEIGALTAQVEACCKALWSSDTATLSGMFHDRANLYGVSDGALEDYSRDAWLAVVAARTGGEGEAPYRIQSIDMPAPGMANAELECAAPGRNFTDTLCFLKFSEGWRVIAKTFHIHG
jgi:hypothetical protein